MRNSLLLLVAACGTTSPTTMPTDGTVAPAGMPIGDPVVTSITPAGGTVTSSDGALSIVIPPDAVAAPVDVSVQLVSNTSFAPVGMSYRLSPSDLELAKPATLVFSYTDADTNGASPDIMTVAAQDDAGYWHAKGAHVLDETAHTLSLAVTSFSAGASDVAAAGKPANDWTKTWTFRLSPAETQVKLKAQATFQEMICMRLDGEGNPLTDDEIMNTCMQPADSGAVPLSNWEPTGGSEGFVTSTSPTWGVYTAPARDPHPGYPVLVSALVNRMVNGQPRPLRITANVDIECPWFTFSYGLGAGVCAPPEWNGTSHITQGDGSVIDSTWTFALDPMSPNMDTYIVKTGLVSITTGPTPPQGCTLDIDASHAIAAQEGRMVDTVIESTDPNVPTMETVQAQGITVWLATYTTHCPNGDGTQQFPFSAMWWPLPAGGPAPALPVVNNAVNWDISGASGTGHVTLTKAMPGA
jgi:hypothetical protein